MADAKELAQVLHGREYWRGVADLKLLRRYERSRKADVLAMGATTDGLQQLFAQQAEPWALLRNWGMTGFDRTGWLKHWVARQAMGRLCGIAAAMAEPIMHHELQPRRDENVEMRHRHEAAAREQIAAHSPWIRLVELGRPFAERVGDRHVAAEARAGHAHPGATEIVVAAVGCTLIAGTCAA